MSRYLVREKDVEGYSPANHHGTVNKRLVSQANVGAKHMEVVLGTLAKGGGALPHAHPGMEQACYLLEGTAEVELEGETFAMLPGDTCFFPGRRDAHLPRDQRHTGTSAGDLQPTLCRKPCAGTAPLSAAHAFQNF